MSVFTTAVERELGYQRNKKTAVLRALSQVLRWPQDAAAVEERLRLYAQLKPVIQKLAALEAVLQLYTAPKAACAKRATKCIEHEQPLGVESGAT